MNILIVILTLKICKKHGIFNQQPNNHLSGQGCVLCRNENITLTLEEFIEKSQLVHGDRYDYSSTEYINNITKVKIICKKHGTFNQVPYNHYSNSQGCPKCRLSKGELMIERYLIENNISYESQKRFSGCVNKKTLPFDFYLPDLNMCIEFDGKQHFESVGFWGGDDGLKYRQFNDSIKTGYCDDNDIRLVRISYADDILVNLELIF